MAIRCRTRSAPGLGPARRVRSHAYRGKQPKRRRVVRAFEIRTARAAIGGTAPALTRVVVLGFVTALEVLIREKNFWIRAVRGGDLVCAYARM